MFLVNVTDFKICLKCKSQCDDAAAQHLLCERAFCVNMCAGLGGNICILKAVKKKPCVVPTEGRILIPPWSIL